MPIGTIVFHAWSDSSTVRDVPAHFVDITAEFTRRHLGAPAGYVVGMDFQRLPHMCASIAKIFQDPADNDGEPLYWIVDEVVVRDADEDDLVTAIESLPRWKHNEPRDPEDCYRPKPLNDGEKWNPVHCAVIMDASGFYQDGLHTKGRTSEKWLRARGWTWLYYPDKESQKNPLVEERTKATNARLKSANGKRRMFCCRHNLHTARAMRSWEMRNGFPYKGSIFAHVCDATTYPVYRFWGKPKRKASASTPTPVRPTPSARRRGYDGIV
jgi:hypothetical protein